MATRKKKAIDFNGVFTEKLRKRFKRHRRLLGVSILLLANYLHIHWSIIRKWEAGISINCPPRLVARVRQFLERDFDEILRKLASSTQATSLHPCPPCNLVSNRRDTGRKNFFQRRIEQRNMLRRKPFSSRKANREHGQDSSSLQ